MRGIRCVLPLLVVSASVAVADPPHYMLTVIGPPRGAQTFARGISRGGLLAGNIQHDATTSAFSWYGGAAQQIALSPTWGYGINDSGLFVGEYDDSGYARPFIADGTGAHTFSPLGGDSGIAYGINNAGVVVGSAQDTSGRYLPFRWSGGIGEALPLPAGAAGGIAMSITDTDLIAGALQNGDLRQPAIWRNGQSEVLPFPAGFITGGAEQINEAGLTVGAVFVGVHSWPTAACWVNGLASLLPSGGPNGSALGVNSAGDIVGYTQDANLEARGALWSYGEQFDLTSLLVDETGWTIGEAEGIDDSGRIVAWASDDENGASSVLLTPIPGPAPTVTLAFALAATRTARRRRPR